MHIIKGKTRKESVGKTRWLCSVFPPQVICSQENNCPRPVPGDSAPQTSPPETGRHPHCWNWGGGKGKGGRASPVPTCPGSMLAHLGQRAQCLQQKLQELSPMAHAQLPSYKTQCIPQVI